ncbi:exosortase E/protease, VPEID-CTERM system [Pararhodobacter sp.]|uniref:exosortase E/protease, VPEID-CTERM system n=1 Tax=Pararhodobacter sp. TaxID=2127056 RepID=UPI002FDD678D
MNNDKKRLLAVAAILLVEVVAIAFVYQFVATVDCHETGAQGACRFMRSLVARAIVAFAAFDLFFLARPDAWARLLHLASPQGRRTGALWVAHLAGVGLILLPALLGGARNLTDVFHLALIPWLAGLVLASVTGIALLAPLGALGRWLKGERYAPLIILLVAVAVPDVADVILPLWDWQFLTALTFVAVFLTLSLFTPDAQADPEAFILGAEGFFVHIARQCSGLEGIALVSAFVAIYGILFRRDLRFPHYWLIVLPLGLLLSWLLNVLRIALLVLIGARVSPDLAVNGFHSYAGWLFFTLLALFLLFVVQWLPWVHRRKRAAGTRMALREDWLAARILPFIAFMVAGVLTSAVALHPDLAYPLKALVLLAALMFFRRVLARIELAFDPVAVGAGLLVGLAWIARQPPPGEAEAALMAGLATLGSVALAFWVVARLLGTMVLVPIVEELFFRGYLLVRLDFGGMAGRIVAVVASSALFAALHGRLIDAFVAGVIFALVMLRRNRLGDAMVAHVVANSVIALWALMAGDLARI